MSDPAWTHYEQDRESQLEGSEKRAPVLPWLIVVIILIIIFA